MATPLVSAVTLLLVLCVAMEATPTAVASFADVNIHNIIGKDPPIQVQCKGVIPAQTLAMGGHVGFGFKPNVWGTTKYSCDFRWGARSQGFHVWEEGFFLAFWTKRPCTHCEWMVGVGGFYRGEAGQGHKVFVHPWK